MAKLAIPQMNFLPLNKIDQKNYNSFLNKIIKDAGYGVQSIEVSEHPIEHIKSGADK